MSDTTATTGPQTGPILTFIHLVVMPGTVVELRILGDRMVHNGRRIPGPRFGYYNDLSKLVLDILRHDAVGADGTYVTFNPVKAALLARCANHTRQAKRGESTSDPDILGRKRVVIDIDPMRPSGISATHEEHAAALRKAETVRAWLGSRGFAAPLVIDSGNGAYLVYSVNLPNDEGSRRLVERFLTALALFFDDDAVHVDSSVSNAARIMRVPGTMNRKGDSIPERPHRRSALLDVPEVLAAVPQALLEEVAAMAPETPLKSGRQKQRAQAFDVGAWLDRQGVVVTSEDEWKDGIRRWHLEVCPFDQGHTNRCAIVLQFPNGGVAFRCLHDSCRGRGWVELRDRLEPGWQGENGLGDQPSPEGQVDHLNLDVVRLDTVEVESVESVWDRRIFRKKVTMVFGDPGVGKTYVVCAIVADVSAGRALPCDRPRPPATVLYLTAEDGLGDTIRPRIEALGGDLSRVHVSRLGFALDDTGLAAVEGEMARLHPDLVVLDPLNAYLGAGVDMHRANETRPVLAKLARLAEQYNCAVLIVHHMTKDDKAHAVHRALGSIDLVAACRSALLVGTDPNAPATRAVVQVKNNLTRFAAGVGYGLDDGRFRWTGPTQLTSARILAPERDSRDSDAVTDAERFLRLALAGGPRDVKEVQAEANANGISAATLRRAFQKVGVASEPVRERGTVGVKNWTWRLTAADPPLMTLDDQFVPVDEGDHLNDSGHQSGQDGASEVPTQGAAVPPAADPKHDDSPEPPHGEAWEPPMSDEAFQALADRVDGED